MHYILTYSTQNYCSDKKNMCHVWERERGAVWPITDENRSAQIEYCELYQIMDLGGRIQDNSFNTAREP
jgi:hypothetical protein